jgi:metal-dependent amidase/aminoacylase/carboxypeptidase family protein
MTFQVLPHDICPIVTTASSNADRFLLTIDEAVVTIGQISCGNTWNVIADHAYVQGTVRSFDPVVFAQLLLPLHETQIGFY